MRHALERTSPMGQPFRGTCWQCGASNLRMSAATEQCENPANLTIEESLILAVEGLPKTKSVLPVSIPAFVEDLVGAVTDEISRQHYAYGHLRLDELRASLRTHLSKRGLEDATPAMVKAALEVDWSNEDEEATVHNVWHAMLKARG